MNNSLNIQSDSGICINNSVYTFTYPHVHIIGTQLKDIAKSIDVDIETLNMNVDITYLYSLDNVTYSRHYLSSEFEAFLSIINDLYARDFDVYIKLRIDATNLNEPTFENDINDDGYKAIINRISINDVDCEIKHYIISRETLTTTNQTSLFDPYANMSVAFDIQRNAADSINTMFGHWCYYFRTNPDKSTQNVTLKSYKIHNVVDMKKIKIIIPDNKFPDSKNIYSEWGIQLADEFVVHIVNTMFEKAFGIDEKPHQHDYLYFPISGIMYEVNATYENKNFMQRVIYSETILVRYEDNVNVVKTDFEEETVNYAELLFPGGYTAEEVIESRDADPNYLNQTLLEAFRMQLHKNTEIVNYELLINRLKLFDNMYLMSKVPENEIAVSFNAKNTTFDNNNISMYLGIEKLSPSRELFHLTLMNNTKLISVSLNKGFLQCTIDDKILKSSTQLIADKRYAVSINISNVYLYASLSVYEYNETDATLLPHTEYTQCDIKPIPYNMNQLIFMGGKNLFSNISIDANTYDIDSNKKMLTRAVVDSKSNIMYDKCYVPIANDLFTNM